MSNADAGDTAERNVAAVARGLLGTLRTLVRYKAWANAITFRTVLDLPEGEALRPRATRFGNIVHTLNHVFVVDDIFRHHLTGRRHGYKARNTDAPPPLADLWPRVQEMDAWYVAAADALDERQAGEVVHFEYVGGGNGAMTRADILLHLVNHATYHRGFVGDMLYQVPVTPPANDFTVYLRDHHGRP
jgi:uncharacterized damage-inducible protein DinB